MAWIVGLVCAAVVGALVWIAAPLVPASVTFVGQQLGQQGNPPTSEPAAGAGDEAAGGLPAECRDLYGDALRGTLMRTADAVLTPSTEPPASSARGLVDALAPRVTYTCDWTSAEGTLSTTLATVPADAGAIAETALPALGFTCERVATRTRCVLKTDGRVETIETAGGLWVSSVEDGWHPSSYVDGIAETVWAG
jgi:hypothetical protein